MGRLQGAYATANGCCHIAEGDFIEIAKDNFFQESETFDTLLPELEFSNFSVCLECKSLTSTNLSKNSIGWCIRLYGLYDEVLVQTAFISFV